MRHLLAAATAVLLISAPTLAAGTNGNLEAPWQNR